MRERMFRFRSGRGWGWAPFHLSLFTFHVLLPAPSFATQEPIADNSFLLEEAYNQGPGVVQHIATFAHPEGGGAWDFAFTQEWPLGGLRHQGSFTLPLGYADGTGTGLGDVALHYRYQMAGVGDAPLYAAPRLSLLLPTGREEVGRGRGSVGVQANLPVSWVVAPALATHWNAGATLGTEGSTLDYNLGASAVWRLAPRVNLLLEAVWLSEEFVAPGGATMREESTLLNPGIRWAHDFRGGLQVVPGVAYTFHLGPASGDDGLFFYLSFEHPFKRPSE